MTLSAPGRLDRIRQSIRELGGQPADTRYSIDPDCERCDGSGLDPDAYLKRDNVWTHAPCSECLPDMDDLPTIDGIPIERLSRILTGQQRPTSLDLALIADATGRTVTWLLHGIEEVAPDECVASRYVGVADSYNGSSFCGCPNCIEYAAEREYEDEV
ncbi:hypothetical protein AB0R01_30720 [Streptomyces rochei]|uniref:hypothetical protein n=1 Tax=Streptomyces rochei TaxID=1928 RepID=UPI00341A7AA7